MTNRTVEPFALDLALKVGFTCVALAGWISALLHAQTIPVLDDEIVGTYIVGDWFSHHLLGYLFQWTMLAYPPQSPIFGNGFLPPYSFGVVQALSHASALFSGRLVNWLLTCVTALIVALYVRAKSGHALAGFFSAAVFLTLPVTVYAGATAFGETWLAFEFVLVLLLVDHPGRFSRLRVLGICVVLGLALLTKLSVLIPWTWVVGYLSYRASRGQGVTWWQIPVTVVGTIAIACIIWPGARDIEELRGIYAYLFASRPALGLQPQVTDGFNLASYGIMAVSTIGSGVVLLWAAALGWLLRSYRLSARLATLLVAIASYLAFLGIFVKGSSWHQIITVQPFLAITLSLCVFEALDALGTIRSGRIWQYAAIPAVIILLSLVTLVTLPGKTLGLYVSLVARSFSAQRHYISGSGELEGDAAEWIRAHALPPYDVCNLGEDVTMMYADQKVGFVRPLYTFQDPAAIVEGRCHYIVLSSDYFKGHGTLPGLLEVSPVAPSASGGSAPIIGRNGFDLYIYQVSTTERGLHETLCQDDCASSGPVTLRAYRGTDDLGFDFGSRFQSPTGDASAALKTAQVTILRENVPTRTDAVALSLLIHATGCSEVVIDASFDGPASWLPGNYMRVFSARPCTDPDANGRIHLVIPAARSNSSLKLAVRVATDNRFSSRLDVAVTLLAADAVALGVQRDSPPG